MLFSPLSWLIDTHVITVFPEVIVISTPWWLNPYTSQSWWAASQWQIFSVPLASSEMFIEQVMYHFISLQANEWIMHKATQAL